MKKSIPSLIFLGVLAAVLYFLVSNKDEGQLRPTGQSSGTETEVTSEDFVWSATDIDQGPERGGSDFASASNLQVSAFGRTYRINDYIDTEIYGCKDVASDYRDSILAQYDSSYSHINGVSYYLCPSMGGGDLFVIEERHDGYAIKHYPYGDGLTPFTELNPAILFTIQK